MKGIACSAKRHPYSKGEENVFELGNMYFSVFTIIFYYGSVCIGSSKSLKILNPRHPMSISTSDIFWPFW
jgi:hypothetical protein